MCLISWWSMKNSQSKRPSCGLWKWEPAIAPCIQSEKQRNTFHHHPIPASSPQRELQPCFSLNSHMKMYLLNILTQGPSLLLKGQRGVSLSLYLLIIPVCGIKHKTHICCYLLYLIPHTYYCQNTWSVVFVDVKWPEMTADHILSAEGTDHQSSRTFLDFTIYPCWWLRSVWTTIRCAYYFVLYTRYHASNLCIKSGSLLQVLHLWKGCHTVMNLFRKRWALIFKRCKYIFPDD